MKLFVWDFHGVLEKGNDAAVYEITNMALEKSGYAKRITEEECLFLSGRRWHDYFTFLLPESSPEEWLKLQESCFQLAEIHPEIVSRHVRLNDRAEKVLHSIHKSPHTQILLSNTRPKDLDAYVKMVKIEKFFPSTHRFGIDAHCQKSHSKSDYLGDWLKGQPDFEALITIGDSPHDMALAKLHERGIAYLYCHPGKAFRESACHYKINDLYEVMRELQKPSKRALHNVAPIKK